MATTPIIVMVQALDSNNDPIEQGGQSVFLTNLDAVAQIIYMKLNFLQGEWWEDLTHGFPLLQSLVASSGSPTNQQTILAIIQQTILSVSPWVIGMLSFSYTYSSVMRRTLFAAEVDTVFGTLTVTNAPGSSATVSPS